MSLWDVAEHADNAQGMLEAAEKLAAASPRTVVYDKKRKAELAAKLAQRWQRWELSNFDYLMQVTSRLIFS